MFLKVLNNNFAIALLIKSYDYYLKSIHFDYKKIREKNFWRLFLLAGVPSIDQLPPELSTFSHQLRILSFFHHLFGIMFDFLSFFIDLIDFKKVRGFDVVTKL